MTGTTVPGAPAPTGAGDAMPERLRLEAIAGPSIRPYELSSSQYTRIGRALDCQLCLPDPSVSRIHAALVGRGGRWFLSDLGSRLGTFLNGVRLAPNQPSTLALGDLVRIGPWELRLTADDMQPTGSVHTLDDTNDPRRQVQTLVEGDMTGIARQRLSLLLECAAQMNDARSEKDLATTLIQSALAGTGFGRAAYLRPLGREYEVEVLAARSSSGADVAGFEVSRSLVRGASLGRIARLRARDVQDYGQSIAELGIHSALCLPVEIDTTIAGFLYLDARAGESRLQPDAAEFCQALSRFCGLALAKLKRDDIESRRQLLEAQLNAARDAQQMILPAPDGVVGQLRYALRMRPGLFVAGDLFDVVPLSGGRVAVCLGDVTGEGVGAGLVMASTQAHLHAALTHFDDPAAAVTAVNAYVAARSALNKFVSLWVGVFDPRAHRLTFVDAGHGHWMLTAPGREPWTPHEAGDIPVGIEPDQRYTSATIPFEPGHRAVLLSDGIIEQRSPEGEQFSRERVIRTLAAARGDVQDQAESVYRAVMGFAGGPSLSDDASIAVIALND
jgi:serine phosphatase RsbU (regulator of sigma subunit)